MTPPTVVPRILGLALAFGVSQTPLLAQGDTTRVQISGSVVDPLRHPIEGKVGIQGSGASVFTTKEGTFRLLVAPSKEMLLRVRRPGYNAQLLRLEGAWNGTILLEPGKVQLPDIQVIARYAKPAKYAGTTKYDDYFWRRRMGLGEFVSREDIDRRQPLHTSNILEGRPGIHISEKPEGTIVFIARCNEYPPKINVYVDGHKLISPTTNTPTESPFMFGSTPRDPAVRASVGEMLNRVNPRDIELVEIFRGPSELPPEFNDGNCAAISIWTRQGGQ